MEHNETQSQSRNKVRDSEKDFGSRFAADLFCSSEYHIFSMGLQTAIIVNITSQDIQILHIGSGLFGFFR